MIKFLKKLFSYKEEKVYFAEYGGLDPGQTCYFQNIEVTKLNNKQAVCSLTSMIIPLEAGLIVQVRLPKP